MPLDKSTPFGELFGDAQPIQHKARATTQSIDTKNSRQLADRRANASGARQAKRRNQLTDHDVKYLKPLDFVEWKLDGVQPKVFKQFQKGQYEIHRSVNLHKVGIDRARTLVCNLIQRSIDEDHRCVRIEHGKGERSNPPAQMKSHVVHWLVQHEDVIAFSSAPPHLGGIGAVLVKIRKGHKAKQENRERYSV